MARYYVKFDGFEMNYFAAPTGSDTRFDAYVVTARDKARATLDPSATGNNWIVSDIIKWNGVASSYNSTGYGFYIEHRDGGGNPTGPQWLIILTGKGRFNNNTASIGEIIGNGSFPLIFEYLRTVTNSTAYAEDGGWAVHYNATGGTTTPYDSGSTWASDGSLAGGDLSAPTTNLYADLATFMPSATDIVGMAFSEAANGSQACLIMDDQKPFLAMYRTDGRLTSVKHSFISGKIVDPYLGTDTFTDGNLILDINGSTNDFGTNGSLAYVYDATGTRLDPQEIRFTTSLTEDNSKFATGEYAWDIVTIASTYLKGYVDADVMKVIGGAERNFYDLFEQGGSVLLKFHNHLAFPYKANVPIFPSE